MNSSKAEASRLLGSGKEELISQILAGCGLLFLTSIGREVGDVLCFGFCGDASLLCQVNEKLLCTKTIAVTPESGIAGV